MKKQTLLKVGLPALIGIIILAAVSINFEESFTENASFIASENSSITKNPKAAIIDQLHNDKPNENYQKLVTEYLETAGYEVDLYTTDAITVNFYKRLPAMNYEFIVIRSHALGPGVIEDSATLFTGEKYSEDKHLQEQLSGLVGIGIPFRPNFVEQRGGPEAFSDLMYFTIGSQLIDEKMVGSFPGSTIILGGCDTQEETLLANSLLGRGASEIVGWNGLITARDNDTIILDLVEEVLINGVAMDEAVELVMKEYEDKIRTAATLEYYSSGASELMG